jgi:quercetin dioxygenase-like cupin family protein
MLTQPIASSPKTGATVHLLGTLITLKASAADTEGHFSLVDTTTAPGQGTPPHIQRDDSEAFYVLEGEYEFILGETVRKYGPGSFLYVPRGMAHGFRNVGPSPSRMLIINVPGGLHENFFLEAGDIVEDPSTFPPMTPPNVPKIIEVGARYGIEMLPPR